MVSTMQQHKAKPKCFSAVAPASSARSLLSPVRTMQKQPVSSSSAASPVFYATPTGRSSTIFATSKSECSTPVFSLPTDIGVGEKKATGAFAPSLRVVSPTSVASPLATPRMGMGGISSGPRLPGGIVGIRLNYDHLSPSREMVFETVDRESPPPRRVHLTCSPCSNTDVEDTAEAESTSSHPRISASLLKLRSGSLSSTKSSSHGRSSRASTISPASPTPQNLKDNPERLAKVKTEMCRYFELGGIENCPWGDKCKL
jgi:hypothetical protein